MDNPNSAIKRIKNHLAYKLGQAMIDFANNGGGYIALFKKLYKIKKQHKKEQKIYQQTIQVFPQLKYPSLEACSDYEQALRYKFHLSYMLGEILIKADKTWYKGSGFKLKNDIKKAKKEFQIFREFFKKFDQINSSILEGLIDYKQLFLKEFSRIKNILKIHQDYQPILDNIFHNFNYFIQNFDLIEEWLLSDDFKERYKKGNHPYPSLLDPRKLNDKNEKINYHNIPAELAWEMNLPLPENYDILMFGSHGTGNVAFRTFMDQYKYFCISELDSHDSYAIYLSYYTRLQFNKFTYLRILLLTNDFQTKKLYSLIQSKNILCIVRDPISSLKSHLNLERAGKSFSRKFQFNTPIENIMKDRISYSGGGSNPDLRSIVSWINLRIICFHDYLLYKLLMLNNKKIVFISTNDIVGKKNTLKTINRLAYIFNLPKNTQTTDRKIFNHNISYYGNFLPMYIDLKQYFKLNNDLNVKITYSGLQNENEICINRILNIENNLFSLMIEKAYLKEFIDLLNTFNMKDKISKYFSKLLKYIIAVKNQENNKKLNENEILLYLKHNKNIAQLFRNILEQDHLFHVKKYRPDIVASWKYYQEFEQMCKELDDDIQEKDFVN
ncbi:TPA: DUF2972 domain-containing protein [Campylobacter jejuni]